MLEKRGGLLRTTKKEHGSKVRLTNKDLKNRNYQRRMKEWEKKKGGLVRHSVEYVQAWIV